MEKLLNHLFDFSLIWKFALSKLVHILFHHLYLFLREAVSKQLTKRRRQRAADAVNMVNICSMAGFKQPLVSTCDTQFSRCLHCMRPSPLGIARSANHALARLGGFPSSHRRTPGIQFLRCCRRLLSCRPTAAQHFPNNARDIV